MKNSLIVVLVAIVALIATGARAADPVNYEIGSTTGQFNAGEDVTIAVGTISGHPVLQIWDPARDTSNFPTHDVGKITITGTLADSDSDLRILIAWKDANGGDTWPTTASYLALSHPGVRNLGMNSSGATAGIEIIDTSNGNLAKRTRLSAFTTGDIRGDISLGQFWVIQCGLNFGSPSGTISANLTGTSLRSELGRH